MVKHIWSIVCKESKIEAETNSISIIDCYENLEFDLKIEDKDYDPDKPLVGSFNFEVVSLFYRSEKGKAESFDVGITVIDPKGITLGEFQNKVEFEAQHNRMRSRVKFNTIALTKSGTYVFQVHTQKENGSRKDVVSAVPIDVKLVINGKES